MTVQGQALAGLSGPLVLEPRRHADSRGWFQEVFRASALAPLGIPPFVQENHSHSGLGVVRGLHHQLPPRAQGKLVRCTAGAVHDVVLDIRRGSPTFGRHAALRLEAASPRLLWVPAGFAHGFQALSDGAEVAYLVTAEYDPRLERAIRFDDPALRIAWPLPPGPLSAKDESAPLLRDAEIPEA